MAGRADRDAGRAVGVRCAVVHLVRSPVRERADRARPAGRAGSGARNRSVLPLSPGATATMDLRVGTSGYQYKFWRGTFYSEKCKEADMLTEYGRQLRTVEIN